MTLKNNRKSQKAKDGETLIYSLIFYVLVIKILISIILIYHYYPSIYI
jgi:hypothetical protein